MEFNDRRLKPAKAILCLLGVVLFLVAVMPVGCSCGDSEEDMFGDLKVQDVYIEVLEGKWPVESYIRADSGTMDIAFEYPNGWDYYISPDENIYRGSGEYHNIFISVSMEIYTDDYPYRNNIPPVPIITSLDLDLEIARDNINGVKIYESKYSIDQTTGSFSCYIYAVDPKRSITVRVESGEGRSLEEYVDVINRFLDTLEMDFDKLPLVPPYVWDNYDPLYPK